MMTMTMTTTIMMIRTTTAAAVVVVAAATKNLATIKPCKTLQPVT